MDNFEKIIRIGKLGKYGDAFIHIIFKEGILSLTGVEGPLPRGNALGSCGQINIDLHSSDLTEFAHNWDKLSVDNLLRIWDNWHLNDMRAGCKHQRDLKWEDKRINPEELPNGFVNRDEKGIFAIWVTEKEHPKGLLMKKCPICDYPYGSKWLFEEVPQDVIDWLCELPETDIKPKWV
jgi:hypothetical protein